jgi:nucleotide-binding universal stress UspA family protein
MKTILAAVDGSEPALRGVAQAAKLAKAIGAKLELVYVSFPTLLPPSVYATAIKQIEAAEAEWAKQVLTAAERSIAETGVEVVKTRRTGAPAEELSDLAEREDVWGVAIGARGHNAVSRVMLGSVTDRLVHICKKPVLVIR